MRRKIDQTQYEFTDYYHVLTSDQTDDEGEFGVGERDGRRDAGLRNNNSTQLGQIVISNNETVTSDGHA